VRQHVTAITLGVADLDRARAFYERLGWKRGNDNPDVVFFQMQGAILSLYGREALARDAHLSPVGSGFGGITLAQNVGSKADVDAVLAEAKAAGARILKPAEDVFWGGYSGYFADPDGHPWEVAFNPFWKLDAEGRVSLT
jgi:catechol 2,3-dioxygenase-like lactoylglutathione lyase family enzyme